MTRRSLSNRYRHFIRRNHSVDVDDEIGFHLEMRIDEFIASGMTPEEARMAAEDRFGNRHAVKSECLTIDGRVARREDRSETVRAFWTDIRIAARGLRRAPAFAIVAIVTLALGIGGVTAIYSVLRSVVLAPLPYPASDALVRLQEVKRGDSPWSGISLPDLLDWRERARSFTQIAVVQTRTGVNLTDGDEPLHVQAALVSDQLFELVGTAPLVGRPFDAADHAMGAAPAVVLSYDLWRRRFSSDRALVGKTVGINGRPVVVRGVMPPSFRFPNESVEIWMPLLMARGVGYVTPNGRWARLFAAYGRLAPGVSVEAAQRELSAVAVQVEHDNPVTNAQLGAAVSPLGEWTVASTKRPLWVLFGAAAVVLLIACVNVSTLALVRATARGRDIAVRLAHGASSRHLARQFLAESTVLTLCASAFGVALAYASVKAFLALAPASLPRLAEVRVQPAALVVAVGVTVAIAFALAVASMWLYRRPNVLPMLRDGGARTTGARGHRRAQSVFVIGEVALAVMLLGSAGLLVASYNRLSAVDPGFRGEGVTAMVLHPRGATYRTSAVALTQMFDRLLAAARGLPGVSAAALVGGAPLTDGGVGWTLVPEGVAVAPSKEPSAVVYPVSDDYFRTLSIPIREGRALERTDLNGLGQVAVVNEAAVEKVFGGRSPVGRRLALGSVGSHNEWITVVGVAANVHEATLSAAPEPQIYQPYAPSTLSVDMTLLVRSPAASSTVVSEIRQAIHQIDPSLALSDIRSMDAIVSASVSTQRLTAMLVAVFAALAMLMATLGIFGVLAQSVAQETRALAIRVALGARSAQLVRSVVGRGALLTAIGVMVGLAGMFAVTGVLSSLLFGVSSSDPLVMAGVVALFVVAASLACAIPAFRATRADPIAALRQ